MTHHHLKAIILATTTCELSLPTPELPNPSPSLPAARPRPRPRSRPGGAGGRAAARAGGRAGAGPLAGHPHGAGRQRPSAAAAGAHAAPYTTTTTTTPRRAPLRTRHRAGAPVPAGQRTSMLHAPLGIIIFNSTKFTRRLGPFFVLRPFTVQLASPSLEPGHRLHLRPSKPLPSTTPLPRSAALPPAQSSQSQLDHPGRSC